MGGGSSGQAELHTLEEEQMDEKADEIYMYVEELSQGGDGFGGRRVRGGSVKLKASKTDL